MNPVVHFEMPSTDSERVKKFYSTVFGWQMQQMGPEMGNYILANTTPIDEKTQRPKEPGAINGGFYPKSEDSKSTHLVISVNNIEEYMKMVTNAGGKLLGKPMDIPGVGKFIMFKDTEGNRVGILQPTSN